MRNLLKDIDKKFLISLMIIIAMLSTFTVYKIYAQEVTDEMVSEGEGMANGQIGATGYLTVNDLIYRYPIFCCSKGTPLNGSGRATLTTELGSSNPEITGKLKPGDEGLKLFETNLEGENTETPFTAGTYTNSTYGEYTVADVKVATPKEAYILAEMINNLPNYENGGFKFVGEDSGHKIEFTDIASLSSASYIVVNEKTIYIIEAGAGAERLVMQDEDGKYYYVEETVDQGIGVYSYVQRAWWNTEAGGTGNGVEPNGLSKEADLFEAYIKRVAKSTDPSTFVEQEFEINGVTGKVHAPEIEYIVEWNEGSVTEGGATYDLDKPTVSWDAIDQEYKIGPFSINYVEEGAAVEGRDAVMFSGITNAELYTDASSEPLVKGEDWDFEWQIGQRDQEDTYEYPHENEVFYIKLKYIDGATKVTDFKFDFKYMNAGGQYESLEGTYYNVTWTAKEKANWCTSGHRCSHGRINSHNLKNSKGDIVGTCGGGTACPHGKYSSHIESTDYWVELESFSSPITSQLLAGGLIGARWYETAELHFEIDLEQSGRLKITKRIVDENGNKISNFDSDDFFTFKVTVDGKTEQLKVRAGSSVYSKLYTWDAGENPPSYQVEEIDVQEGYEVYEILNSSGTLNPNVETINVLAKNKLDPHEGRIQVTKKVTNSSLNGRNFELIVKVTGSFEYDGRIFEDDTYTIPEAVVTAGGTWTSNTIKWYGEEAPTYVVDEVEGTDYEIRSITPRTGTVDSEKATKVTIINEALKEVGRIKILKTLENADRLSKEYIESLRFTFDIQVDGYAKNRVSLKPIKTDTGYEWNYISGNYYWEKGQNPNYTITEVDLPVGTEFVSASSSNGTQIANGVSGTLTSNGTNSYTVINNFINRIVPKEGNLEIVKTVNDDSLVNNEYRFTVKVTGSFEYKGNYYENKTVYLTNDSATDTPDTNNAPFVRITVGETKTANWISDNFKWFGEAPKYSVEENMSGYSGVKSVINPSQGELVGSKTTKVIAENRLNLKTGALHIIKTLENANNYSDEYIKSLVFKFHITVGEKDYGVVSLKGQKVNNNYIWEYKSEYTWDAAQDAPTYTIEEVELPVGTEFVSANSPNGNATVTGTKITGTLKPDSEEDFEIVNNFINKLTNKKGYLEIQKKVLDDSLNSVAFKFNAKITGTFEYNGTVYSNQTLELNDITVNAGSSWKSGAITWYGEAAPTYTVTEVSSDIAELVSVINSSGTLVSDGTINTQVATFINKVKENSGTLQITKKLEDGAISDEIFYFDITVDGYETYTVGIKAGETYRSQRFVWNASETAPNYVVQERQSDKAKHISMTNGEMTTTNGEISGSLVENENVNIVCINKLDKNSGKIKVTKEVIVDEKQNADSLDTEFTVQIVISGTFEIGDESVIESTRVITETVKAGGSFETPEITWYGNAAPTYTVTETSLPEGWTLENISNGNGQLTENSSVEVVVTNSLKTRIELDLTLEMAGRVWEDTRVENKESEQVENYGTQGIFDEDIEVGIDGVEVYIYKVLYQNGVEHSRTQATAYEDGSNIKVEFPIYTENGGIWSSPRMAVPALSEDERNTGFTAALDVEFVYDGQTYEPTDFLKTSNGDANSYRSATTAERDKWAKDSMALDLNREEVDNRISQVYGYTPIDGQGNTIGKVKGNEKETTITYKSTDYAEGLESTRKISEVQTTDSNGVAYDLFKVIARTSQGGLTYPFDNRMHLESIDKYIDDFGLVERYKYSATYNYTLNINLGLLKREDADIGLTKDLYSAKVIANEKMLNYKFNTLADLTGSTISRQLKADDMNISYELGLYKTDYYYRAEIYQTNATVYDAVNTFYKSIEKPLSDTELDVFLTYKINIYNESPNYIVGINSIDDYFDGSFGKPVLDQVTKYVQTVDGVSVEAVTEVANKSYVETSSGNRLDVNWINPANPENPSDFDSKSEIIKGSDGIVYKKMTANFGNGGLKLASGEKAEITVTFKVQKDDMAGVKDAVIMGQKANIAEIANYSTYYEDGRIAGKIDKDSAPANVNIEQYNVKSWYEDDTDSSPILNLKLVEENRQIQGLAWEDKEDTEVSNGQLVGNGVYDEGEALIGGLTTQLVEKVTIKNAGSQTEYTEYDFLWPTNRQLDSLGGKTLEELTGFDSTIETSRTQASEDANGLGIGEYRFDGVPVGNYVVRFLYGNDKTELVDSAEITGDPTALKSDGLNYSENENILTANYDSEEEGRTPAIYNGQDFKTTTYQSGIANTDSEGYLNNEWHDLTQNSARLSDARDNEARRLQTIANSETITTINGEVLVTANDKTANHTELYRDYSMYADTAKINVALEDINSNEIVDTESLNNSSIPSGVEVKTVKGKVLKDGIAETNTVTYTIKDIDVGLEERSETEVVLDKQISSIKLTTSDNKVIFNAMYDISYEAISAAEYALGQFTKIAEKDGKYIVAKVNLNASSIGTNVLQAINKVEDKDTKSGTKNFRFINIDETILQGSTIEINYKFTALNVSEVDRVDSKLENIDQVAIANNTSVAEEILRAAEEVEKQNSTKVKPVGSLSFDNTMKIGSYLGTTYYQGTNANGNDSIVTTTVRQLVDYVDNDTVFAEAYNTGIDNSWRHSTVNEVTGNGYEAERLLSKSIVRENNILDKNDIAYITDQKNNVIVSIDNKADDPTLTNKGFEVKLLPFSADDTKYTSSMNLIVTRTIAAETDADSLSFDNLSEIVKIENTMGRRDVTAVPGNANPREGEFETSLEERDSSATELITLTPPTGIETHVELTLQILVVSVIALIILSVGIIIIKKKVLTK